MAAGALSDLSVVELGNMVSAPFCGKLLASLGAEVIKIEQPGQGDPLRKFGTPSPTGAAGPSGSTPRVASRRAPRNTAAAAARINAL